APLEVHDLARCAVIHAPAHLDDTSRRAPEVRRRLLPTEPTLVVGQPTGADPTMAPQGGHTLWLETHVPAQPREGSWEQFLDRVLDRLDAHAPGLRGRIVGQATHTPAQLEAANPTLVGGDLGAGS